jgi:tetratricopeptide (TPR) repeat protein
MKLAIAILVCAFGVAAAQPNKDKAAAAFAEGQRRYNAGEYRPAAAKFLEAYGHDADPAYLFNVAQSYRFAHDCAQAARYYRQFLAAVASAPNLAKVRGYLDEMDACVRREAKPPPAEPPTPAPTPTAAPTAPIAAPAPIIAPTPSSSTARTGPPGSRDAGATQRHVGLALGGAGLVAIAVGAWFHHDLSGYEDHTRGCTPAAPCTTEDVARWSDQGHTASTIAISGYAVGGAALVAGATLYLLGRRPAEQPIAVAPTPRGAVITAGFAF